ncbi:MAG: UDP-N-acetylglucosamine--N-acetylmuramyl-(pentapeptide) pyrophosphoryl-undecaprenol N-acetylglucosamine transferase [archaeon]
MKAYISTCGMGVGHVARCEPIAAALSANGSDIIFSTYSDGADLVRRKNLPSIDTVPLSLCLDDDGAVDFKRTAATHPGFFRGIWLILKQIIREVKNMVALKPDIVISDSRPSSVIASKLLRIPTVVVLNQYNVVLSERSNSNDEGPLDRLFFLVAHFVWFFVKVIIGEFWSLADSIVIPDLPPPNTLSIQNLSIPTRHRSKIRFVGPIANNHAQGKDKSLVRKHLGLSLDKPVIFAPISVPKDARSNFVKSLERVLIDLGPQYEIVMSRCVIEGLHEPKRQGNMLVFDWIDNLSDFYDACDIVICRAGHGTIMNSILSGKPMVVIPLPNHPEQIRNAARASELGIAKTLLQSELNKEQLNATLKDILNEESYTRRVCEIETVARGTDGIKGTLEVIHSVLGKI